MQLTLCLLCTLTCVTLFFVSTFFLFYRYGDNIQKVWSLRFASAGQKTLHELQEFFLTIYPHTQLGGAKRVVSVYARGQQAAAGRPNGEEESEENEEESGSESGEGEGEEEGGDDGDNSDTESQSSSNSNRGSDSKSEADEKEEKTLETERTVTIFADVPLSTAAAFGASPLSPPIAIAAATTAGIESDKPEHTAGRKRRSVEDKEGRLASENTMVGAEFGAVGAAKRRRR